MNYCSAWTGKRTEASKFEFHKFVNLKIKMLKVYKIFALFEVFKSNKLSHLICSPKNFVFPLVLILR